MATTINTTTSRNEHARSLVTPRMRRPPWRVWLPAVFAIVVLSFVMATVFSQLRLSAIDRDASDIADNAMPSIEELIAARREVTRVQTTIREQLAAVRANPGIDNQRATVEPIWAARRALDTRINNYVLILPFAGEDPYRSALLEAQANFEDMVVKFIGQLTRGDLSDADKTVSTDLLRTSRELSAAIGRATDFNAEHAHSLAEQIRSLREKSMILAYGLDTICLIIAITAVVVLGRAMRSHMRLAERHQLLLETRASELEEFAGRVAHDIRSPIGTVTMALDLASRAQSDSQRAISIARGKRATERVVRLIEALLGFAKAAAKPDQNARANVAHALDDVVADLTRVARDAHIDLRVESSLPSVLDVVCEDGVLASMISNLASNAIKYMGDDADTREVVIRTAETHERVRIEVEDTGPGLAPGLQHLVFEPYVRGQKTGAGIGLGLATVRRLAEAHGGSVGVLSKKGAGCMFWFELPKAGQPSTPPSESSSPEDIEVEARVH